MRRPDGQASPPPRVVDIIDVGGHPAQVLERVDGPDLVTYVAANPFRLPRAAATLAGVQVDLHGVTAPPELPSTHERLTDRIGASPLIPEAARVRALDLLGDLPHGAAFCHGDLSPTNVLVSATGPVLIDWAAASRGDPMADVARTRLMFQVGELPPGTPMVARALGHVARATILRPYDRHYRGARPVDPAQLDRWTAVAVANRLTEDIPEERTALLAMATAG